MTNEFLTASRDNSYRFIYATPKTLFQYGIIAPKDREYTGLVMIDNRDKVIGYGFLSDGYINNLYIDPEYRGLGYGTALMDELMKHFKGNRIRVEKTATDLISFYKKVGFSAYAEDDLSFYLNTCKNVPGLDNIILPEAENKSDFEAFDDDKENDLDLEESLLNEVYPHKGETQDHFISRFMKATKDEYPDLKQRFAVCMSYWNKRKNKKEELIEDTRTVQISNSKNKGMYKNQKFGKNRFERKKYSKLAATVKQYNSIDMNDFFKRDTLIINIPVIGESDNYTVTLKIEGIVAEMAKNIKSNNNKFEFRTLIQAITKVFNTKDVYTKCNCLDFKYNFAHWNIVKGVSVDDTAHDPGPGAGIANPNDDKGRGCKHILLALSNADWIMKVASVIKNYIFYMEEHNQKAFTKVIFPKMYGLTPEEAQEKGIIPEDVNLATDKNLIDQINDLAKNRGKFQKGSNVNPVYADKLSKEKEEK